jgi:hypothetical protein
MGIRKNGYSGGILNGIRGFPRYASECDDNRIIEYYVTNTSILFYFIGYSKPAIEKNISDSGSGSDSVQAVRVGSEILDSGVGTEVIGFPWKEILLSEVGQGTEVWTLKRNWEKVTVDKEGAISKQVSESGSGAEVLAVLVQLALAESGSGADAINVLSKLILQETGSGADAINILRKLLLLETGSGADALELLVKLALAETGSGADSVSKTGVTQKVVQDQNQPNVTYL